MGKHGCFSGFIFFIFMSIVSPMCAAADVPGGEACEKKKGLVILVEFPDIPPRINLEFVRERFNKLDLYVRAMSYGKVCMDLDITGWHRLPDSMKHYAISAANLNVDKGRVSKLIQDAIDAADAKNDLSRYSFVVLFLGAQFKEYGMVGLCGYPGMLGWKHDMVLKTRSGQVVPGGVAIFTFQAHLGTLFHDIAHVWGGVRDGKRVLPCLYDHDIQAKHPTHERGFEAALINMGYWDPLSCHFRQRSLPPPGLSSWTKLRLGWIAREKVRAVNPAEGAELLVGPLEDGKSETLVIKIPIDQSRYYLVENRQPIGTFDSILPSKGILIMAADDKVDECRHGKSPVKLMNAEPAIPHLQGAAFDLPAKAVFTDRKNGVELRLLERAGDSYRIRVGRPG
ncbi:MAG: hypothetical protein C4576_12280 [Desulfobacteraceae bacterium]|nr:MAG: hypothetical protein C4576_12280 [Desulfobacteraceae bacterium]